MFAQPLTTVVNPWACALVPLLSVAALLILLTGLRITAWLSALIASAFTFVLAAVIWGSPLDQTAKAHLYGAAAGFLVVDWITFWGVVIFNTLVATGRFDHLREYLISEAAEDVRVQVLLLAWAFGALLEGLLGFGYPWCVVAPILIALGVVVLEVLRVAAIANNAPVSFGALGVPIVALAAVTNLPLEDLSAAVGCIVAFQFKALIAGTAILVFSLLRPPLLRPRADQLGEVFRRTSASCGVGCWLASLSSAWRTCSTLLA